MVLTPVLVYAAPGSVVVDLDGTDVTVNYDAEGVDVLSAEADLDFISLIIDVEVSGSPGILEITFDRDFFDSVFDGTDDAFIIIADGDEPDFEETDTNADSRTIRIELPTGTDEVEIIGTQFGTPTEEPEVVEEEPPVEEPEVVEEEPPVEEPEVVEEEPEVKDEPKVMEDKPKTECGPGTILKDGVCVLDQTCGPGTILKDGVCVLDATQNKPVGSGRDLAMGIGAAFVIAFIAMIILWLIGKAGKDNSSA